MYINNPNTIKNSSGKFLVVNSFNGDDGARFERGDIINKDGTRCKRIRLHHEDIDVNAYVKTGIPEEARVCIIDVYAGIAGKITVVVDCTIVDNDEAMKFFGQCLTYFEGIGEEITRNPDGDYKLVFYPKFPG